MKTRSIISSVLVLFIVSTSIYGQKTLKLVHDGTYYGQITVTYHERGIARTYTSDKDIGKGWTYTIQMSEDVSNITAVVSTNRGFGIYGEGCKKFIGNSGGTFTFGGLIYSESCNFKSNEVNSDAGVKSVAVNINEILPGGNTHLHNAVKANETSRVKTLLNQGVAHMETKNNKGFTPLHEATQLQLGSMIDLLISRGANVMALNNQNKTPLYMAINQGDKENAQKFINNGHDLSQARAEIERAIQKRDMDLVRMFLINDADVNMICNLALKRNNIEVIELALGEFNAVPTIDLYKKCVDSRKYQLAKDILDKDLDPNPAMDYAIAKKSDDLINKCLEKGADANKALKYGVENKKTAIASTALFDYSADANLYLEAAVKNQQQELLQAMMDSGGSADRALTYAIQYKKSPMLDFILGYNPSITNSHVSTLAAAGSNEDLMKLIQAGGSAEVGLSSAMKAGKYPTAELMIQNGAAPSNVVKTAVEQRQKKLLQTALNFQADPNPGLYPAIKGGMMDYAELLFQAGGQINNPTLVEAVLDGGNSQMLDLMGKNSIDLSRSEYMQKAVQLKKTDLIKVLLDHNANPNDGMMYAVKGNSTNIVRDLIAAGASGSSSELLIASTTHNSTELTQLLLSAGAAPAAGLEAAIDNNAGSVLNLILDQGVDATDDQYLNRAVSKGKASAATVLIRKGSDPLYIDGSGNNYIHIACLNGHVALISTMTQSGVDVNGVNNAGDSPLHIALSHGRGVSKMTKELIASGANVNTRNSSGKLPLDIAKGYKTKRALKKAGAKKS